MTVSVCQGGTSYRSRINGKLEHNAEVAEHELIEKAMK